MTEDKDFLRLAKSYMREGRGFSGVIFIPQRRWDLGRIVVALSELSMAGDPQDFSGRVVYLSV